MKLSAPPPATGAGFLGAAFATVAVMLGAGAGFAGLIGGVTAALLVRHWWRKDRE